MTKPRRHVNGSGDHKANVLFNEKSEVLIAFPRLDCSEIIERLYNVFPKWADPELVSDKELLDNHYPAVKKDN